MNDQSTLQEQAPTFYALHGKALLDKVIAAVGLVFLSPIMLGAALAVKLTSPGSVFFRQIRTGQFGKPFTILKFRTMYQRAQDSSALVTASGDPRITPIGAWLRRSKIDELPQLVNILLGQMSIVGPRPEVPSFTALYTQDQQRILSVKPGITSPASLILCPEEVVMSLHADEPDFYLTRLMPFKINKDLAYFQRMNLRGDLLVVVHTVFKVLNGTGPEEKLLRPGIGLQVASQTPGTNSRT